MKPFFALALFFFVLSAYVQDVEAEQKGISETFILKAGYFEFPGLTHTDENGRLAGLVNEITVKTLENAKIPYSLESYPAARFYDMLAKGEIHFFNGLNTIPVVKENMVSSSIELFPLEMRVYRIGEKKEISQKEELSGHSVILVKGFTYKDWGAWIRDRKNNVEFSDVYTHESAFKMLKAGRAEYLLNYKYIDTDVLQKIDIPGLVITPLYRWNCYFNIHKSIPDAQALLQKIENSDLQLIQKGQLKKYE